MFHFLHSWFYFEIAYSYWKLIRTEFNRKVHPHLKSDISCEHLFRFYRLDYFFFSFIRFFSNLTRSMIFSRIWIFLKNDFQEYRASIIRCDFGINRVLMFELVVLAVNLRPIEVDPYFLVIPLRLFSFFDIKTSLLFLLYKLVDWNVATSHHLFRFKDICIYQP